MRPFGRDLQVAFVDIEPDDTARLKVLRGDDRIPDPEERIENGGLRGVAMEADAVLDELRRKARRVRPLGIAIADRLVRNEPSVAAAALVAPGRVSPARDVALVRIRHPDGEPVD